MLSLEEVVVVVTMVVVVVVVAMVVVVVVVVVGQSWWWWMRLWMWVVVDQIEHGSRFGLIWVTWLDPNPVGT